MRRTDVVLQTRTVYVFLTESLLALVSCRVVPLVLF